MNKANSTGNQLIYVFHFTLWKNKNFAQIYFGIFYFRQRIEKWMKIKMNKANSTGNPHTNISHFTLWKTSFVSKTQKE